jgi:hypothetical protein
MLFALGHKISSKYIDLQSNVGDMGIMWNFSRRIALPPTTPTVQIAQMNLAGWVAG